MDPKPRTCAYFALCENETLAVSYHVAHGVIPTCKRCGHLMEVDIFTVENHGDELYIMVNETTVFDRIANQTEDGWDDFEILEAYFTSPYGVSEDM